MSKPSTERAILKQKAFDDARNALLTLTQLMPVGALTAFIGELTGEELRPVLSPNIETREKQEAALAKVEAELRRAAYDLDPRVKELARSMKVDLPLYEWKPQSLLVLKHWYGILQYWAVAIGLDVIPLLIILLAGRLHDGVMGWDDDDDDDPSSGAVGTAPGPTGPPVPSGSPLGLHPHPRATAARSADKSRKPGEDA